MLNFYEELPISMNLTSLSRYGNTLLGLNNSFQLVEVDMANRVLDILVTHQKQKHNFGNFKNSMIKQPYDQVNYGKYLSTSYGNGYYFISPGQIDFEKKIISQSNSKAYFVEPDQYPNNCGTLHAIEDTLCCVKYHKNHEKFSINIIQETSDKKIIRLLNQKIQNIQILSSKDKILYEDYSSNINLVTGENFSKDQLIHKSEASLLYDDSYSYILYHAQGAPKKQITIKAYTQKNLSNDKPNYSFQLKINCNRSQKFVRIQNFNYDILVGTQSQLKIYDIRKLVSPFQQVNHKGISDFYYDSNLHKVYISAQAGILVYQYV